LLRIIKDYYEVKSKLVNTLKVTYLAKGSVGNLYRYRSEEIKDKNVYEEVAKIKRRVERLQKELERAGGHL